MIAALVHGNEPCGAVALARLMQRRVRPIRGRLTFAFMNPAAAARRNPDGSLGTRAVEEDLNRLWSPAALLGPQTSLERERARALRPLIDGVDALLDLHSMHCDGPPLILAGMAPKGLALARAIAGGLPIVMDGGHAGGTRLRDYGGFGQPASPKCALLVECGGHDDPAAAELAYDVSLRFLAQFGMLANTPGQGGATASPVIEVTDAVTVEVGPFRFARDFLGLETVARAGTLIGRDGGREVRTPYDSCTLVMPSTSSRPGDTAVRLGRRRAD
jgi:predicted deacylase